MEIIRALMLLCLLPCLPSICQAKQINDRPIIGVLAQKMPEPIPGINGTSYISAAYIKWLESAGARVVPIDVDITKTQLDELFSYINGVVFPGGDAYLMNSPYRVNAEYIFKLAMREFDRGEYFPLWGTCLGFQAFAVITSNSDDVLTQSKGTWDKSMPLEFTRAAYKSKLFSNAPWRIFKILKTEQVTYNAHYNCVSIDSYKQSHPLHSFYKVLSTNKDAQGKKFISTMEGHKYPFYAVQWHPEMVSYEFNYNEGLGPHIAHSQDAILASQYSANFFVSESRKSTHRFHDKSTEQKYLIYNYSPVYTALHDWFDEQAYVF